MWCGEGTYLPMSGVGRRPATHEISDLPNSGSSNVPARGSRGSLGGSGRGVGGLYCLSAFFPGFLYHIAGYSVSV